jgi:hypothetical protein
MKKFNGHWISWYKSKKFFLDDYIFFLDMEDVDHRLLPTLPPAPVSAPINRHQPQAQGEDPLGNLFCHSAVTHVWTNARSMMARYAEIFLHTFRLRFIPEGVAKASQIFLREYVGEILSKWLSYETYCRRDRW